MNNSFDSDKKYEKSLRYSLLDGIFATITWGIISNYLTPFALSIKATNFQIGILNSLPSFLGIFSQLFASDILEKVKSRVKLISTCVYTESTMYIFLILSAIIFKGNPGIIMFIAFYSLACSVEKLCHPVWSSLMSDTVSSTEYGRYFAWRNKIFNIVFLLTVFSSGIFLDSFKDKTYISFPALFLFAGLCRYISGYYISKMTDIPVEIKKEDRFSYLDFILSFPCSNFARFVVFISFLLFAESIAGTFFAVYMINELKFNYSTYMAINTAGILTGIISFSFWGYYSDKIGNGTVIKTTSIFIPFLSFLWLISKNPFILAAVNMFSSYIWTGFFLCEFNYRFDACSPSKRTRCIAYSEITKNLCVGTGFLSGGYLATKLPPLILNSKFLTLFTISGIAKLIVVVFLLNTFKEVRKTEEIPGINFILTVLGGKLITRIISSGKNFSSRTK